MRAGGFGRLHAVMLECCVRSRLARRAHRLVVVAVMVLTSAGLAGSLPAQALQTAPAATAAAASKGKRDAVRRTGREIVSLRTRTSRTFVGERGARLTRVSPVSLHTRDAKGRWQTIDSRLVRSGAGFVNRRGRYSTRLPLRLGKAPVRVRRGPRWVDFRLRGADAAAQVSGPRAHYENALPGVDVEYEARPDSVKETLVLAASTARRRYVFDLAMSSGLRPRLLRSNGLNLVDRRGRARLFVAAPFMFDAKGHRSPRVAFKVANVAGRWRLTMTPDQRWLDRKSRAWPVTVDPVFYADPDRDCSLTSGAPETSGCADSTLAVGQSGGAEHTSAVRFDLSSVPSNAEVLYSSLETKIQTAPVTGVPVRVFVQPLSESWTGAASWNRADGTDRWGEPGGEFDEARKAAYNEFFQAGNTAGWFAVHNIVREWVKGTRANHGFLLRRDPTTSGFVRFHSTEAELANSANQAPLLDVEWVQRPGFRRGYKFETQRLSDRISLSVNAGTGNLLVSQTDFSMPGGLGPDVAISRTYNSVQAEDGAFGRGWTLSTGQDVRVRYNFAHGVRYYGPGGLRVLYEPKNGTSTTEFVTPPGFDDTMTRNASTGEVTLTENASQAKQVFNSSGRLLRIEDRNGRRLTPEYDTATNSKIDRLETAHTAQSTSGDEVRFTHTSATKLTQMTDPAGRTYAYGYDASNRLTSYTDPENATSYKTLYEYNGPGAQLSKITTPQGNITLIEYYADGHKDARKVKTVTRVTNTSTMTGATTTFEYFLEPDGTGAARVTDPVGTATTDANDRVTRYQFDDQARVTKVRDALGRDTSTKLTSTSKVETYTAAGNTGTTPSTTFSYDGDDNLTGTSTPTQADGTDPMTTSASYAGASGGGTINANTPGSAYLPTRGVNEQGGVTKINYAADTAGNPSGVLRYDATGTTLQAGVSMQYASTSIDSKPGQLASITDGRGKVTSYSYDAKGNVSAVDPPGTGANQLGTTRILYDVNLGRADTFRDGNGKCRVLGYDNLDRVTSIEFRGDCPETFKNSSNVRDVGTLDSHEPKVTYTYDRDGNQTSEVTREEVAPGGTGTSRTRSMGYDKLSRVTSETFSFGGSNTYTYDLVGNLRSLTDAGGTVEYAYDAVNQQRAVYEPGTTRPTKFVHNKDGLREKTVYPNNVSITWDYDHANRIESIHSKNPTGSTLQNLAYKYRQPTTSRQTPLRYEAEDLVLGRRTRYAYDDLDRLVDATTKTSTGTDTDTGWAAVSTPIARYQYALDAAGNITQRAASGSSLTTDTRNFAYDEASQLCWRSPTHNAALPLSDPCASGTRQTAFDANGNELTGASGTNRTAAYHLTDQTKTFTISGSPTSLVYLGAGQDRWITEGTGTFQHNILGAGKRTVGASTDYFTRDEGGTLVSRRNGTARHYYLQDALGSVTGLVDSTGVLAARYDYEPYGARDTSSGLPTSTADVPDGQFGFGGGYRSAGGLYHYGARYYDPTSMRWTQTDPLDQTGDLREGNLYLYASADPVGLSDPSGEAVPLAVAGGVLAAQGVRTGVTIGARWATTRFAGKALKQKVTKAVLRNPTVTKTGVTVGTKARQLAEGAAKAAEKADDYIDKLPF